MPATISCVNLKGGVGKTAIAVNFAAYCGRKGYRTLLVDLDPQTNATFSCMKPEEWEQHATEHGTVADLLGTRGTASAEGILRTASGVRKLSVFENVDLIPSHLKLFTIDLDLVVQTARETKLRKALQTVANEYDVIVFDCPPNLTLPTQNALAASAYYVVPISPDYLSGIGVGLLVSRVREFATDLDHDISLAGIVVSRVGREAHHRTEVINALRQEFQGAVLDTEIHERVAVAMSAEKKKPIYDIQDADAANEFSAVSDDLLHRVGLR